MGVEPNCLKKPFHIAPHLVNSAGGFLDGFGLRKEALGQLIGEHRSAQLLLITLPTLVKAPMKARPSKNI